MTCRSPVSAPGAPAAPAKKVFTLGTGRRSEEEFIEILEGCGIAAVIDVRRFPESKIETFRRDYLELLLAREGIDYRYLGAELGGFRRGGYEAYTLTGGFRSGVDLLETVADPGPAVIICAEKLPWKCHRKWIARELTRRGWSVVHVIEKGRTWEPGKGGPQS